MMHLFSKNGFLIEYFYKPLRKTDNGSIIACTLMEYGKIAYFCHIRTDSAVYPILYF